MVSFDMRAFSLVCLCFSFLQRPAKLDAQPQHFCSVFSVSRMCLHKGNTQLSRVLPCVLHVFFFMAILVKHLAKLECSYSGSISNHCSRMWSFRWLAALCIIREQTASGQGLGAHCVIVHTGVSAAAIYLSPLCSHSLEAGSPTAELLASMYNHDAALVPPTAATNAELGENHTDSQQEEHFLPWLLQSRNLEWDGVPKVL